MHSPGQMSSYSPTRYINEGQPVSLIEAMAAGCAIVATRFRAIAALLEDGVNGLFVGRESGWTVANALLQLAGNRQLLEDMQRASLRRFDQHFTQTTHLSNLLDVLGRAAGERGICAFAASRRW